MADEKLFSGSQAEMGVIDTCPNCRQRAELMGNGICGDCNKEQADERNNIRTKLPPRVDPKKYIKDKDYQGALPTTPIEQQVDSEKQRYLDIIEEAPEHLVDEIIKDIYEKKILHYDFNQIVRNDRWFSLMDLRRMALRIKPNFKKALIQEVEEIPKVRSKGKRRKTK